MGSVLSNTAALAKHIVDQADRVVREVKELVR
jgi:conjugal transfer/entry exclusion protein